MELKSRNAASRYEKKVEKKNIEKSLMKKSINFSGFAFMDESFS